MKYTFTLPLDADIDELKRLSAKELHCGVSALRTFRVVKRSVDARHRNDIKLVFTVEAAKETLLPEEYPLPMPKHPLRHRPIVVGFGPAGIFCAYALAKAGLCPIVLERGEDSDSRRQKVDAFLNNGILDTECNVQFGEGGAGTFSDGKLNTGIGDRAKLDYILRVMARHGAPAEILYEAKPHVGTDRLSAVVKSIRQEITALGGEVRFSACFKGLRRENGLLKVTADKDYITDALVLAVGHSATDTYRLLYGNDFAMESKAFSVGFRVEHLQRNIDTALYGDFAGHPALGAADYKLVNHTANGSAYSFCMCPGGEVIASSSDENTIVTNGMSRYARNGDNANSALLVGVDANDFGGDVMGGVRYREALEKEAFRVGGGDYRAPIQLLGDFMKGKKGDKVGSVLPTYKPGVTFARLDLLLPPRIIGVLRESVPVFDRRIRGFAAADAVLTGVETRSSAPLRVQRDETMQAVGNEGVYPCGEGCGYAGGIMSAAVDGLRVAEAVINAQ